MGAIIIIRIVIIIIMAALVVFAGAVQKSLAVKRLSFKASGMARDSFS